MQVRRAVDACRSCLLSWGDDRAAVGLALMIDEILERVDSVSIGARMTHWTIYVWQPIGMTSWSSRITIRCSRSCCGWWHVVGGRQHAEARHGLRRTGRRSGAATGLLLSLGLRRFSVWRMSYGGVVSAIRKLSLAEVAPSGAKILALKTGAAVRQFLTKNCLCGAADLAAACRRPIARASAASCRTWPRTGRRTRLPSPDGKRSTANRAGRAPRTNRPSP